MPFYVIINVHINKNIPGSIPINLINTNMEICNI